MLGIRCRAMPLQRPSRKRSTTTEAYFARIVFCQVSNLVVVLYGMEDSCGLQRNCNSNNPSIINGGERAIRIRMFCLYDIVVVVARVWILSVCPPSVSCSHFVCSTGTSTTGRALGCILSG